MSAPRANRSNFGTRLTELGALISIFGVLWVATRTVPSSHDALAPISAVGFLLLAGSLMSELAETVGLPHLSGYLAAGIIAGPHLLNLVDHETVQKLSPVNTLALALIALAGGAELRIDTLLSVARSLAWSMLLQSVSVLIFMSAVFAILARTLPFTRDLPFLATIGVGLLWGVLAVSRSPSATLAILAQTRPSGPVTRFTLAFVMSSDVVVIILLAIVMVFVRPLFDPSAGFSFEDLAVLGHELVGSVALGTSLGLVLSIYLRLVGKHLLLVLLALGFGLTEALHYLRFDPLLTFVIAGFFVQNLSEQGEKLLLAVEETGSVVFVVFFATAGAHLNLPLLRALWPVALVLAGSRTAVTFVTQLFACRIAGDPPVLRKWAWSGLVSQAGLTLGLSVVIERAFPSFGPGFRALAIATIAINEMVGPILFKLALDRTGETGAERTSIAPAPAPP